jgi:hypothetical protein
MDEISLLNNEIYKILINTIKDFFIISFKNIKNGLFIRRFILNINF